MRLFTTAAITLASALAFATHATADKPAPPKVVPHAVSGNITMLEGMGGNIGVSTGPDGVLIVDAQFQTIAPSVKAALKTLGHGDSPSYVLSTHWHQDHTDGNVVYGPHATVVAHDNVRDRLAVAQNVRGKTFDAQPKTALPNITFAQGLTVHFNGEKISVRHYPAAHTDGDAVVHFETSKVIHMGDLFFNGKLPFVDLETGGRVQGVIRGVEDVLSWAPADAKVIPGHGPLTNVEGLKHYLAMLRETVAIVQKQMAAGKSEPEILKAGLPKAFDALSWSFVTTEKYLKMVYNSLALASLENGKLK